MTTKRVLVAHPRVTASGGSPFSVCSLGVKDATTGDIIDAFVYDTAVPSSGTFRLVGAQDGVVPAVIIAAGPQR